MHLLSKAMGKDRRVEPSPQRPMFAVVWGRSSQGESHWKGHLGKCEEVKGIFGLSKSTEEDTVYIPL